MRRRRESSLEERFLRHGAVEPERRRAPGTDLVRFLLAGVLRFAVLVVVAGAVSLGLALLVGWQRGSDPAEAAAWGFYAGGIVLVGFALVSGGRSTHRRGEHGEDLGSSPAAGPVYIAVGVALLALGVATETFFRG